MDNSIKFLQKVNKICMEKGCECSSWDSTYVLEVIINSFSDGIVVLNSRGKVCFLNKAVEDILGYKIEDLLGEELHSIFITDEAKLSRVREEFCLFASTGTGARLNRPINLNLEINGRDKHLEVIIKPLKFQGEWIALGILTDVTKTRELERELKRQEDRFRVLFEAANDAIFLLDEDGFFVDANPATLRLFGCTTKEQLIGKTPYDLSPKVQANGMSSKELALDKIKRVFSGKPQRFEWLHKRLDGSSILFTEVSLSRVEFAEGPALLAIVRDITDRKILEQQLLKKNELILELSETAPIGILRIKRGGEIEYINPRAKEILQEIVGEKISNSSDYQPLLRSFFDRYSLNDLIEKCVKDGKSFKKEIEVDTKSGKKWYVIEINPIGVKEVNSVRIALIDITSEKKIEMSKFTEQRKNKVLLESLPHPVWLINSDRKIIAQNEYAKKMGSRVDDYCWNSILDAKYIPPDAKETMERTGIILPGIKCRFCKADDALMTQTPMEMELDVEENIFDAFWIPVEKDMYLHYLIDVTKYKKLHNKLLEWSIRDPLTGLYNRRYFIKKFEEEVERVKRHLRPFSIIMLDIDDFKNINDTFGHNVGDEVLIAIANSINKRIRKVDLAARWGGEEFVILLPETDLLSAVQVANDIRKLIENIKISKIDKITASFGVAQYKTGDDLSSLIDRADRELYRAKRNGKNLVCYEKKRGGNGPCSVKELQS